MTLRWPILTETAAAQRRASDPRASAWVRANAGSGKTHVLAQRVVRLLLAGVEPSKILCLTFTKAAAANMSMRVFSILAKWSTLGDGDLRAAIKATGARGAHDLRPARRLFARAVETPGGLKIQTIHAFCERLLHLFPFEANVAARFEALDGEARALLLQEAREEALREALEYPDAALAESLARIGAEGSQSSFDSVLHEALAMRDALAYASQFQGNGFERALGARLGLSVADSPENLTHEILESGLSETRWQTIVAALDTSSANDVKLANAYRNACAQAEIARRLEAYIRIFYKSDGEPKGAGKQRIATKKIAEDIICDLESERDRIGPLIDKLLSAQTLRRSADLQRLASRVMTHYTRLKNVRGLLDFEDLIERTSVLLQRADAGWVLYKLDAGIDHVLVDEAQDTSPKQWDILRKLVSEFFAGRGARGSARTLFAVGDEKQSIFSFQGVRPQEFEGNAQHFAARFSEAGARFESIELKTSFRSAEQIMSSVDTVFSIQENYTGLSYGDEKKTAHSVWKTDLPGLVEIWPVARPAQDLEPEDWRLPVDAPDTQGPDSVLAQRIARKIAQLLEPAANQAVHDANGERRAARAGDIMILVRRRNRFFDAVIRALKAANVPVAGADRLKLTEHIAVMDLIAAGRMALLPQDDLMLACALKSPLFGFDDEDLLRLAPGRSGALWMALNLSKTEKDVAAARRIVAWREMAHALGPFKFYATILGAEGGRRDLLARLGMEAGDAVDEFLRLALAWERDEAASLTGFLHNIQSADIEIKRDMEAAGEAVRVMTVHAAKGLEAKIVFLPDTCSAPHGGRTPTLLELADGGNGNLPLWRRNARTDSSAVSALAEEWRRKQQEEHRRLLYVALTRAEERLYICGYAGPAGPASGCWYNMIAASLGAPEAGNDELSGAESVLRIGEEALCERREQRGDARPQITLPAWLTAQVAPEPAPAPPVRPSHALGAADQFDATTLGPVEARRRAMLEGNLVHAMLQYLPGVAAADRRNAAQRFLDRRGAGLRGVGLEMARREALAEDVLALMENPALAPLFGPQAQAEVAIAGRVACPGGAEIEIVGRIDRLAQSGSEIVIADFKTGRAPRNGRAAANHLAQMALYRAALTSLFPGKPVRTLVVYTAGPIVCEIADTELDEALAQTAPVHPPFAQT